MSEFRVSLLPPEVFETIEGQGYVSLPLLNDEYRERLLIQAEQEPGYELSRTEYTAVNEEMEFVGLHDMQSRTSKAFSDLSNAFRKLVNESVVPLKRTPFRLKCYNPNEVTLQRYKLGMLGVTPHIDGLRYINIIAIFNLGGDADLSYCEGSRDGRKVKIDTTPGNVVLLKAIGYNGASKEVLPYHTVSDIRSERYICTLRQDKGSLWD
jgi:hypothetical protein